MFISYKSSYVVDAPTYFHSIRLHGTNNWEEELAKWKAFSDTEKQEWRDKAATWLEDYKNKFPHHYEKLAASWKKIDW